MRTFFQDFKLDNGAPITVEYGYAVGSETTYSPMSGACGGDPCEISILSAWPNTPDFNELCRRFNDLDWKSTGLTPIERLRRFILRMRIKFAEWRCQPSDAERERMEEWLIEHHVDEPDESDYI
jgi:hypothetical protein